MRPFVLSQLANFAGTVGGSATFIALPWLALSLTHSSTQAAVLIAMTAIPILLISPFLGALIDKFGRRRVAWTVELAIAACVIAVPILHGLVGMNVLLLGGLSLIKATVGAGPQMARKALVPDVAEAAGLELDKANSIHESVFSAGFAAGPGLASLLIAAVDPYAAFWLAGAASIVSAAAMFLIHVTERQEHDDLENRGNAFVYAMQGLRTLGRIKVLGMVFLGFLLLAIVYVPTEMVVLPRYYNGIHDPAALGAIITTMATTGIFTTLTFSWLHKRVGYANILRIALIGVGLAMLPMSFLPPLWAMLVCGVVVGGVWGPIAPLLNTVIQKLVVANLRGRVFALELMMWNMAPITSFIVVGLCLDKFGVRPVYFTLAASMAVLAIALAFAPRLKELRNLD